MAIRNTWMLPALILIMAAALGIFLLSGGNGNADLAARGEMTSILNVPAQYATIQAAIDAAQAGDIIRAAPGVYHENIIVNKPVALTSAAYDAGNAANDTTVLDGGNGVATILIPGGLSAPPTIHGFVIRNGTYGIEAHSPFHVESNFLYGSQIAIDYQNGSGGTNRDNVYFNSSNDAVHIEDMTAPLLIENNRVLYAGDDGIELDFPGTAVTKASEVDIWNNVLAGSSQDGIKLVDYGTNPRDLDRRVMVAGNLLVNNQRAGLGSMHGGNTNEDYSGADIAETIRVFNNTFYGNDYGISGGDNLIAFNNIIANTTSRGAWRVDGGPESKSVIAYTLFWRNRVDTDQTQLGPGDIFGQDPLFVGAPGPGPDGAWGTVDDDFSGLQLQPGSSAVDKGTAQYIAGDGEAVPPAPLTGFTGAAPDLGWKEAGAAAFPTAPVALTEAGTFGPAVIAAPSSTSVTASTATSAPSTAISPTPSLPAASEIPGPARSVPGNTPRAISTSALTIQSVTPGRAKTDAQVTLTISGSGFEPGATVDFEGQHETPPDVQTVTMVDSTTMAITIHAVDDARDADTWNIRVTNPDGATARLVGAFTIVP